jgi:hypothetical protein
MSSVCVGRVRMLSSTEKTRTEAGLLWATGEGSYPCSSMQTGRGNERSCFMSFVLPCGGLGLFLRMYAR